MTAQGIIEGAMRLVGHLGAGHSANAAELADGLTALNRLISQWNAEGVMIYYVAEDVLTLVGATTYAWTAAGAITSANPVKLKSIRTEKNGMSFPAKIVKSAEWDAIRDRSATGSYVEKVYYDYGFPTGQFNVWPPPASGSLYIHSYKAVLPFGVLGDTVTFPAGYETALVYNLAIALAPELRRQVADYLPAKAEGMKAGLAKLAAELLADEVVTQ